MCSRKSAKGRRNEPESPYFLCDKLSGCGGRAVLDNFGLAPLLIPKQFNFEQCATERLTHYLFRYPAKFHPPVARALIEQFSSPGDVVLDPFCGSGTLLVEALPRGRHVIGVDIDPVAAFVSRVKTMRISTTQLRKSADSLLKTLARYERPAESYRSLMFDDINNDTFLAEIHDKDLVIPDIPNMSHWFRNYVAIDLATIRQEIFSTDIPKRHRDFLTLCFASIIRNSSNADPVPVSGLEVTSHMLKKEKQGREINPFKLFSRKLRKSLDDWAEFQERMSGKRTSVKIRHGDSTKVRRFVRTPVDVIITSPPYHNAVDYYRRHTLEMYWLNLVENRQERLALRPKYIGRDRVAKSDPFVKIAKLESSLAKTWEAKMADQSGQRAMDFKHYVVAMMRSVYGMSELLQRGQRAVFVVGKNSWNGYEIPTVALFDEIVGHRFRLVERYSYPIKNRYMTYARHNNANIDREFVLVYARV